MLKLEQEFQTEKIQLAVVTPFNILANYTFPLTRHLCRFSKRIVFNG